MHFRPYPILTLVAVPALAALVALGVWQTQRAGWKADLIRQFQVVAAAPPLSAETVCADGLSTGQVIAPQAGVGPALRMFGHDASGTAGWRVFQTGTLCNRPMLVQTGFEALAIGGPGGVPPTAMPAAAAPDRFIVEPWPEKPLMPGSNSPDRNEWHWFDPPAMAAAVDQPGLDTRFILTPFTGTPDFLARTPPETHIGYAVTWFGMAAAFAVIYALFHARAGRLRFGKTGKDQG
jgi:surfeit locus 1 family protein